MGLLSGAYRVASQYQKTVSLPFSLGALQNPVNPSQCTKVFRIDRGLAKEDARFQQSGSPTPGDHDKQVQDY